MTFVTAVTMVAFAIPTSVAISWPSISSGRMIKAYTISSGNTIAYSDASLTKKKGTIYASDEIYIHTITTNSKGKQIAYCSYPVNNGKSRKNAVIPLSAVTSATRPEKKGKALAAITTYRRTGSSSKSGSISKK